MRHARDSGGKRAFFCEQRRADFALKDSELTALSFSRPVPLMNWR
ncbi:hypothetical protein [Rubidibacter lacunae]|nr:hypothetical protein [Rubidibacter lacunae]